MTRVLYLANVRLPTEKAHGLQIMQNCEAFAAAGAEVTLWAARRVNTPELRGADAFAHYGVERRFRLRRLPTLDLLPFVPGQTGALAKVCFAVQMLTYIVSAWFGLLFARADVLYSRDAYILLVTAPLARLKGMRVGYEAHTRAGSRFGRWAQVQAARGAQVFTTTARLGEDIAALGVDTARIHTAHDGIRAARFADMPGQAAARQALGWPADAFIVGYVGRLQTMAMDKGVGLLIDALAQLPGACLGLVGGPEAQAEAYRARWAALGLDPAGFLYAGQVAPDRVPLLLAAFDVCVMPLPWTEHFAYYASAIKLFEYMASGRALVASDLPSTREVVADGETALLFPPGDAAALAAALQHLQRDPALRERLAAAAARRVADYTWDARARRILAALAG